MKAWQAWRVPSTLILQAKEYREGHVGLVQAMPYAKLATFNVGSTMEVAVLLVVVLVLAARIYWWVVPSRVLVRAPIPCGRLGTNPVLVPESAGIAWKRT